jgi:APA family basic amino acid/polyamine antiporter
MVSYLLLNVVYLYALPVAALAQEPVLPVAEKAAAALWGPASARWAAGLICVAIAGGASAMVWAGPRIYWAMAKDGLFLPWAGAVHPRSGVPVRALLLQSAWASLLILTGTFEQLVIYSGVVLAGFTALTVGALLLLRRQAPLLPRPYLVPLYPWLPGCFIAGAAGLVGYSLIQRPTESLLGLGTVLAGIPLYWYWQKGARPNPP